MLQFCLKCRKKKTESKNSGVAKTNKEKLMLLTKFEVCNSGNLRLIKEEEASGL